MPQMAPMNWICLYLFFSSIFILILIMSYFSFMYPTKMFKTSSQKLLHSWKW
uniref:ATP synthase complex subunit 8 n=1 Tax=Pissodes strobi TaxID=49927 RepID=A0A8F5CDJ3_PISSR|nr:ATP synthase F0 subunit 8 [Pissodes strobi]